MTTRAELKREYKEMPKEAGVFQIRNTVNGRVYLGSSLNLHGPLNKHRFMLAHGMHDVPLLQKEWHAFGPDAFVFEVVQVVEPRETPGFRIEDELELLEEIWLEKLQPIGDKGYNRNRRIRE